MELKDYQQRALDEVKRYLLLLAEWKEKNKKVIEAAGKEAAMDVPAKAWEALGNGRRYLSRKNGLGEPLPNFCLKLPTGAGKTLIAAKAIDSINTILRGKRTGLILWVVPTQQIYRQTMRALRDREHPYRQHLDIASAGRTVILEKSDRFLPLDMEESLCVLMLMLPSAARQTKETLKMFRDSGGFQEFFPPEDHRSAQEELLKRIPNLDCYEAAQGLFGRQIKTSLGNTLRLLSPVIILDEGHKAYSEIAQDTLRGFNPSLILELSATPHDGSNVLVEIFGRDLLQEGMIKMDLHILNKASTKWEDTLLESVRRRQSLEEEAEEYRKKTNTYIRPICLIQVERVGENQRDSGMIHAEDVREWLMKKQNIPADHIALKTSEKDELKEVDDSIGLLSPDCPIRYIITKQALQEGWDCSFAYVLAILTNPSSRNALTQLVGRILRQPYARKTGVSALDESYVHCFKQRGSDLMQQIQLGLQGEGLGDLHSHVLADSGLSEREGTAQEKVSAMRPAMRKQAERVVLPVFVVEDGGAWRRVNVSSDIDSRIPWEEVDTERITNLTLMERDDRDTEYIATLSEDLRQLVEEKNVIRMREGGMRADGAFFARHLMDCVPNPWIAYAIGCKTLASLVERYGEKIVVGNFVYIVEQARRVLAEERDRLARNVFETLVKKHALRFLIIGDIGFSFPKERTVRSAHWMTREDNLPLQRGLFDPIPSEEINETERKVAWYLDGHDKLFFWYRNEARKDYFVQGWRKHKIYPDFIFTTTEDAKAFDRVFVIETKGGHLMGNEDTVYKQDVFDLCNVLAQEMSMKELGLKFHDAPVRFEVVPEQEWEEQLATILA